MSDDTRRPFLRVHAASRIRRKLILLHTVFSIALGVVLILALRVPLTHLVDEATQRDALLALERALSEPNAEGSALVDGVTIFRGTPETLGLDEPTADRLRAAPGEGVFTRSSAGVDAAYAYDNATSTFVRAQSSSVKAQRAVENIYLVMTIALLAVYALIALTLEVFVLPKQVYAPIERLRAADDAVQRGERDDEIIPDGEIRADELGEIMRSRNASIVKLRDQETRIAETLEEIERVASELKRKNHLLENARRNLQDQDRLASLGMMSAGIAHELNTPLSVLKGCVEELRGAGAPPEPARVALMLRVVHRLERLSESLLDFARARPPSYQEVTLRRTIEEAWTLVSLDRGARSVVFQNDIDPSALVAGDEDRLTQVFVNLLRNAVDAAAGEPGLVIEAFADTTERDGACWVSVTIRDSGPGIEPAMLPRLFEPFASTNLDAHGTGLGLAVAEGIVKEHHGVIVARNRPAPDSGAEFEVVLPASSPEPAPATIPG